MKKRICEIIRINHGNNRSENFNNSQEYYTRLFINPETFSGICGCRYQSVYCDLKFLNDSQGQFLVEHVFKSMATLPGGEGFVFYNP